MRLPHPDICSFVGFVHDPERSRIEADFMYGGQRYVLTLTYVLDSSGRGFTVASGLGRPTPTIRIAGMGDSPLTDDDMPHYGAWCILADHFVPMEE